MKVSSKQFALSNLAGQVRGSIPLTFALPCVALALAMVSVVVSGRAPEGPKCLEPALSAPGFTSLAPQAPAACIRIRI